MGLNNDEPTARVNVVTPLLTATLDRTGVSSRNASHILLAFATDQGMDVDALNLSSSSIERNRVKQRKLTDDQHRQNIQFPNYLSVHWDGKAVTETKVVVERLPILVTGYGTEQLLQSAKLSSGTGISIATAVLKALQDWKISDRVQAMCFDTTNSNTGK